jgi:hypothetical protein
MTKIHKQDSQLGKMLFDDNAVRLADFSNTDYIFSVNFAFVFALDRIFNFSFLLCFYKTLCRYSRKKTSFFLIPSGHLPRWEMWGGVRGKENEWSYKAQDGQELKQNVLGSHGVRT